MNTRYERSKVAKRREEAFLDVAQRVDRILTKLPLHVKEAEDDQLRGYLELCAGFTDGADIYLNMKVVRPAIHSGDSRRLSAVLGVNYHETGHILFTPRMNDPIVAEVQRRGQQAKDPQGYWYAFNLLEDMRSEMLFWATYEPSGVFFKTMILDFVLRNEAHAEMSYPWLVGRLYLPTAFRQQAADLFVGDAEAVAEIVDEYQRLVFPRDFTKGIHLVTRFYDELAFMREQGGLSQQSHLPAPSGHDGPPTEGRAYTGNQESGQENLKYLREWLDELESELDQEGAGDGAGEDEEGEEGESYRGSSSTTDEDGAEGDAKATSGGQGEPGEGEENAGGAGDDGLPTSPTEGDLESFMDAVEDLLDDTLADEDLSNLVQLAKDSIEQAGNKAGDASAHGPTGESLVMPVHTGDRLASQKVLQQLRQLRIDAEPSLHRDMTHGRIDPYKVVKANARLADPKTVFDTWDPGMEDETEMDAIILIDQSSSMTYKVGVPPYLQTLDGSYQSATDFRTWYHPVENGTRIDHASRQVWIVKRALDKIGASTTVVGYNTEHTVLMQPMERVGESSYDSFSCSGGTDPTSALKEALRIFQRRYTPNKLLFLMTDGEFHLTAELQEIVKQLHHEGVVTVFLPLVDGDSDLYKEEFKMHETVWHHTKPIMHMSDLGKAIGNVVRDILREITRHVMV